MLGMRIASLRMKQGLSQTQLASKLNISPSAIGMYEQGRREPSIHTLAALARVFDVSLDYLLTGHRSQPDGHLIVSQMITLAQAQMRSKPHGCDPLPLSREELLMLIAVQLFDFH